MNDDILKGKWAQLKGRVKEQWGKLTDDEIDQLDGRRAQVVGQVGDLARVGIRLDRPVESFLEPGRGDQLHRPRNLADVANRFPAFNERSCFGHIAYGFAFKGSNSYLHALCQAQ